MTTILEEDPNYVEDEDSDYVPSEPGSSDEDDGVETKRNSKKRTKNASKSSFSVRYFVGLWVHLALADQPV